MLEPMLNIYDEEEYMYPKMGESEEEYEKRMDIIERRNWASMTEEEKRIVTLVLNSTK